MPEQKPKRSKLKVLLTCTVVLVLLLVVAFFVVTSAAFVKSFVLPKVSKAVGAEITVDDVSISAFSQVKLDKLKVQAAGQEPIVEAKEVLVRYSLTDIIGGNINVSQVSVVEPIIKIVKKADGT